MATEKQMAVRLSVVDGGKAKAELRQFGEEGDKAFKKIKDATTPATAGLKAVDAASASVRGRLEDMARQGGFVGAALARLGPIGLAAGAGIGAVALAATKGIAAFAEYERQHLLIQNALRATEGASGKTAAAIEAQAEALAQASLATDDEIRAAAVSLLNFREVSGDTFDRVLKLSTDLAGQFGSVSSAALALAKAVQDPVNGLKGLRDVGIKLSGTQKEVIQDLVETGRQAEAVDLILSKLEGRIGGAGAAGAAGVTGSWHRLGEAIENRLEDLGKATLEILHLSGAIDGLADALERMGGPSDKIGQLERRLETLRTAGPLTRLLRGAPLLDKDVPAEIARTEGELVAAKAEAAREAATAKLRAALATNADQKEKVEGIVAALKAEGDALRQSDVERAIRAELQKNGIARDSDEGERIAALVAQNFNYAASVKAGAAASREADRDAERHSKEVQQVKDSLDQQISALGTTAREQAILNELTRAHVADGEKDAAIIREQAGRLYDLTEAQQANIDGWDGLRDGAKGFLSSLRQGADESKTFIERLGDAIGRVGDKLWDLAENGVIDLFLGKKGTAGGGFLESVIGALTGGSGASVTGFGGAAALVRHSGGLVDEGPKRYRPLTMEDLARPIPRHHSGTGPQVGPDERLAILDRTEGVFTQGQMKAIGERLSAARVRERESSLTAVINVDARGAEPGVGAEVKTAVVEALREYDRYLPGKVDGMVRTIQNDPRGVHKTWPK